MLTIAKREVLVVHHQVCWFICCVGFVHVNQTNSALNSWSYKMISITKSTFSSIFFYSNTRKKKPLGVLKCKNGTVAREWKINYKFNGWLGIILRLDDWPSAYTCSVQHRIIKQLQHTKEKPQWDYSYGLEWSRAKELRIDSPSVLCRDLSGCR